MRRDNEDRNAGSPHQMLGCAANKNMLKSGEAVRRCDDEVEILGQGELADPFDRPSDDERGVEFDPAEFHGTDIFSHLLPRVFQSPCPRSAREPRQVWDRADIQWL